ncbi:GIY-YIG nuclease family protein [Kiritimatiellota bacterium B12222]|nr:GIY-YIG nuclease family protein [Kiritimatiellota bacterium B12222]
MITIYVLEGLSTERRYVGITNHLSRRLEEHQAKKTKGGQLLGEFKVLYTEHAEDYKSARVREKWLKSGQGREWLLDQFPRE